METTRLVSRGGRGKSLKSGSVPLRALLMRAEREIAGK